jgi:TatD DNase family protein
MTGLRLIDSHCHLDSTEFDQDRRQVLANARRAGVSDLVVPGVAQTFWPHQVDFCRRDPGLHLALGLHPVYLAQHRPKHLVQLREWLTHEQTVAVGEIGLDYQIRSLDRGRQQELLERQLEIAARIRLPVILHVRKAHDEMLRTLSRYELSGGICHAFNGSHQQAYRYIEMGFRLGFGGMLTYRRSTRLRSLAGDLPLESLVLETDAPDLTVASHRYQRNSPEYLPEVLAALTEVRQESSAEIAATTRRNTLSVLRLSDAG